MTPEDTELNMLDRIKSFVLPFESAGTGVSFNRDKFEAMLWDLVEAERRACEEACRKIRDARLASMHELDRKISEGTHAPNDRGLANAFGGEAAGAAQCVTALRERKRLA